MQGTLDQEATKDEDITILKNTWPQGQIKLIYFNNQVC
jgi:hypothetical protein